MTTWKEKFIKSVVLGAEVGPMTSSTLEDLLKHLSPSEFNEARIPIIRDYWVYSPSLAEGIVHQQQRLFEEEKGRVVASPAFPEGTRFIPSPGPDLKRLGSWNIIEFYGKNYPALRELEIDIARHIVFMIGGTATQEWLGWKKKEIQELVDKLVTFNESTKQYLCPESRESLFQFLHDLAHRHVISGSKTDIVTSVFDAYRQWMELQQTDQLGLGTSLLEKIARHYSLPIPNTQSRVLQYAHREESSFFHLPEDPYEGLWLLKKVGALYREYFSGVTALNLPVAELSELLLSALKPEADDKFNQRRFLLNHRQEQQLRRLCGIIREQRCRNGQEIEECAGLEIPNYRLLRKLGQGVYKDVYHGINVISGGERAIKIINVSARGQANIEQRGLTLDNFIVEEAKKSEQVMNIGNQHLAQVYETRSERTLDKYLIVEELLEETLADVVHRGSYQEGSLEARALLLEHLTQLAEGLAALHRQGLVHGDLTPTNIGLKEGTIKITDFGLASTLGSIAHETSERVNVGSIITRAPELFAGKKATDKADVWSFGVIAYIMATGIYPPFIPETPRPSKPGTERRQYEEEVLARILAADLTALANDGRIPSRLRGILPSLLRREPEQRKSMAELYEQLKNPVNLFYVHYSEQGDQLVARYQQLKEQGNLQVREPRWLPFQWEKLHSFDYIFLANERGDLVMYRKIMSVDKGKELNPFTIFPETEEDYQHSILTLEQADEIEMMRKPSGMGAFQLRPYGQAIRYYLISCEGWDKYEAGLHKKMLLLSHPTHQKLLEDYFEVEEIKITSSGPSEQMLELICQQLRKVSNDRADRQQEAGLIKEELVISRRHESYVYDPYKCGLEEETVYLPRTALLPIISEALEKGSSEATLEGRLYYRRDYSDDMSGGGIDVLDEYNGRAEVKVSLGINEGKPSFGYHVTKRVEQTTAVEEKSRSPTR